MILVPRPAPRGLPRATAPAAVIKPDSIRAIRNPARETKKPVVYLGRTDWLNETQLLQRANNTGTRACQGLVSLTDLDSIFAFGYRMVRKIDRLVYVSGTTPYNIRRELAQGDQEGNYPARTTIEAKLANRDFLLEIECVAEA